MDLQKIKYTMIVYEARGVSLEGGGAIPEDPQFGRKSLKYTGKWMVDICREKSETARELMTNFPIDTLYIVPKKNNLMPLGSKNSKYCENCCYGNEYWRRPKGRNCTWNENN